jgi:hypothetical protein
MDLSSQTDHRDLYKTICKLEITETEIYKAGQTDMIGFLRWQRREFCKLLPSAIVTANKNRRKRVRSDENAGEAN